MTELQQPTVLFISYSHDSDEHRERVLSLSERLRRDGYETRLDRYVNGTPEERWPRWMLNQLDAASHVLVVCTETYYRRFRGHERPDQGRGVDWEGALITNELYDQRSRSLKFVPIVFDPAHRSYIPEPLRGGTCYVVEFEADYQALCDFLDGVAGVEPGPRGERQRRERRRGAPITFPDANRPQPDLNLIRDRLTRFNDRFVERRIICGFLNGYKSLHDSIHKLQDNLEALRLAADSVRRASENRTALGRIAIRLKVSADSATVAATSVEYPEDFEWAKTFGSAVGDLRLLADGREQPLDIALLDSAVEVLKALPNRQTELNRELLRCVKRLRPDELNPLIADVLRELGALATPSATTLAAKAQAFRDQCATVAAMATVHDLCQQVDTALSGAARIADLAAIQRTLFGARDAVEPPQARTDTIDAKLKRIVQLSPDDDLAAISAGSAEQFLKAMAEGNLADAEYEFGQLTESFRECFVTVDDRLLEQTGRLVSVAAELDHLMKDLMEELT